MSFEKEIKMGMMMAVLHSHSLIYKHLANFTCCKTCLLLLVNNDLLTNRIFSTIELATTTTLSFLNRLLYSFRGNYKRFQLLFIHV